MGFLVGTVLTLFIITSLFLIFMVLIQAGKGGGGLGNLSGGSSQTTFGASGADVLTKATRYSAIAFIALAFTLSFLFAKKQETILPESRINPDPAATTTTAEQPAVGEAPKATTPESAQKPAEAPSEKAAK
ncbi:MAG: preprotein translocase subunit SecG [Leptospiraceae bacterium]|nr:preprotein translocase subunit SecG [Leptospiraceae bacterium]